MTEPSEKIANYLEKERQEREQKERLEWCKKQQEKAARVQEEYNQKVAKLGQTYKCHHCGIPARIPNIYKHTEMMGYGDTSTETVVDWSKPGDLKQCYVCKHWFCKEHRQEYILYFFCTKCVEKM